MEHRKSRDPESQLVQASLLMDTYGALLTERQRQFMRMHYEEDLSFSEIAREFKISRQAVHDSVKHATESLYQFEKVLGLVEKSQSSGETRIGGRQLIERLDSMRQRIQQEVNTADLAWVVEELGSLIALLKGDEARESAEEPKRDEQETSSVPEGQANQVPQNAALTEESAIEEAAELVATPEPETVGQDPSQLHEDKEMESSQPVEEPKPEE